MAEERQIYEPPSITHRIFQEAALPNTNWRARCGHSLYVGEFEAVLLNAFGTAHLLLVDAGVMFAIPADIGRAMWSRLSSGDLISVRWNIPGTASLPVALSVDAMDGRTSIASSRIADPDVCETRGRRLSQPQSKTVGFFAVGNASISVDIGLQRGRYTAF